MEAFRQRSSQRLSASATASSSPLSHRPIVLLTAERGTLTILSIMTWDAEVSPVRPIIHPDGPRLVTVSAKFAQQGRDRRF